MGIIERLRFALERFFLIYDADDRDDVDDMEELIRHAPLFNQPKTEQPPE